ncbi:A/G-specific DNA-adenine glycosylase [Pontibacter ummariensis]|uniref:Adenine DNA glycosylase n=1 Tax=Pontibacter ummariensis TaxID=1610492 RepID=A0A239JJ27_9BACT|nr:A/G-specific adenine glycosylase [Pontibacter ummariensis]PRY07849.1 A/G-specific DNA-adenine glycosylase [Pontibacter ummariensis]SNT06026.1 A/G-specific DNA-adenine glycosylase [Pontibacter ummariensis]
MDTSAHAHFANPLLRWYGQHRRPLPWRDTTNPYYIWLSEVILQQTRVAQGLPYYQKFVAAYPTVEELAAAPEDEVLRLWQGLGYYSRARNMHHTAQVVVEQYGGKFPDSYTELIKLKGVGSYTAAAIAAFAFQEQVAVLDGNVFRVLARVFGIADDIAAPTSRKVFQKLADELVPAHAPDTYNQAIMEFGAIQCTPVMPDCLFCPLQQSCFAFNHGMVQELPVKSKAKAARPRYFHYLVLQHQGQYYLRKRLEGDIWQGLYDFYLYESESKDLVLETLLEELQQAGLEVHKSLMQPPQKDYKHVLSHQKITARFYQIKLESPLKEEVLKETRLAPFNVEEIEQLPKPILINNYMKDAKISVHL